jgi:hypothetical protein
MRHPFGSIITVLRDIPGGVDTYGDPTTASTIRTDIAGCGIAPRYSSEPNAVGRNGVVIGLTIFAPYGSDILFTDRIEINGGGTVIATGLPVTPSTASIYTIEGDPADWLNPFTGSTPGMEISVKKAVG